MYTPNWKVTSVSPTTLHMTVATFQNESDARFYANTQLRWGKIDVKVYAL